MSSTCTPIPSRSTTPTDDLSARPGIASTRRCERPTRRSRCRPSSAPIGALIYLSLGSLGSADVELMQRLIDVLGRTPHRYIVSKGPLHDTFDLPANMWGAQQVPQTNVLPEVDLVITHGGNNTTTESFHFGKPMVAAAAVLGPVRQRPTGARDRLRGAAVDLHVRRRRADRCRGSAAGRRRTADREWRPTPLSSARATAPGAPPTSSKASPSDPRTRLRRFQLASVHDRQQRCLDHRCGEWSLPRRRRLDAAPPHAMCKASSGNR